MNIILLNLANKYELNRSGNVDSYNKHIFDWKNSDLSGNKVGKEKVLDGFRLKKD